MELRPPGTPVDDPFLAAVRRRHPDVDIVLLPPEPAAEEPDVTVDDATVREARARVEAFAAELWAAVAPLSRERPRTRLRYGEREADVRAASRLAERRSDGYAVLVRLRHELEQRGWEVARPPGRLERLTAGRDGGRVTASYAEATGAMVVEVASADLPVGVDRARSLVRASAPTDQGGR